MNNTIKTFIPKSEEEFLQVKEGELVKISFADDRSPAGLASHWTRYGGLEDGRDFFAYQETAKNNEDAHLVVIQSSQRDTHQYDRNIGVRLNHFYQNTEFIGPRHKEEYDKRVRELREAGLWKE